MIEEIKIPISKTKLALVLIVALLFLMAGMWLTLDPERFDSERQLNLTNIMIVGIVVALFFGAIAVFIIKKLVRTSYGLIINDEGITDYSTGVSLGLIKWADIVAIRTLIMQRKHKLILVEVRNPETYIASAPTRIIKIAVKANYRFYGSPIHINPGSLKSSFTEVFKLIQAAYLKQLQENNPPTNN